MLLLRLGCVLAGAGKGWTMARGSAASARRTSARDQMRERKALGREGDEMKKVVISR